MRNAPTIEETFDDMQERDLLHTLLAEYLNGIVGEDSYAEVALRLRNSIPTPVANEEIDKTYPVLKRWRKT